jgi:hypothetical protein
LNIIQKTFEAFDDRLALPRRRRVLITPMMMNAT